MNVSRFYGGSSKNVLSARNLNALVDNLSTKDFETADIFLTPPSDNSSGDSEESDAEEGTSHFVDHFSHRILCAPAEAAVYGGTDVDDAGETQLESSESSSGSTALSRGAKRRKEEKPVLAWKKGDLKVKKQSSDEQPAATPSTTLEKKTPVELFEQYWDDQFWELIKEQSIAYSKLGNPNSTFDVSVHELKLFFAILLVSGYSSLPRRDMYWSLDVDVRNDAIASAMSRNRFRDILRNLHFADNTALPENDKFGKVRPLIIHLNDKFLKYLSEDTTDIDVDESMVPYFSHHSCKQRIQGKPIRYGFKFWSMNSSTGYLISTEPYQGKGTHLSYSELGLGSSVVQTLAHRLKEQYPGKKFSFYVDNFFTGIPLVQEMTKMGYGCTGTLRQNRMENCPLQLFKKDPRGSVVSHVAFSTESNTQLVLLQWKDNAVVRVVSNCCGMQPLRQVKRYSAADKKYINVDMPHAIHKYNLGMGGTDQMDRNISEYRVKIRNNKWWWQVFSHLLSASLSNSWIRYREICTKATNSGLAATDNHEDGDSIYKSSSNVGLRTLDFLSFIREIVGHYLLIYSSRNKVGRPSLAKSQMLTKVPDSVHYSISVLHYPINMQQLRCRVCKKNTTFGCGICLKNMHPVECFKTFHESSETSN